MAPRHPSNRTCAICRRPTLSAHSPYCRRCHSILYDKAEKAKRRKALEAAYDPSLDRFRCHWSRVPLEEKDTGDPFHICFDHEVPTKSSALVASSALMNSMKAELGPEEFLAAVHEFAAHRAGEPFDRDFIDFRYWRLRAPAPHPRGRGAVKKVDVLECIVCGNPPLRWSYYCKRCRGFVWMHKGDQRERARAMREAWDGRDGHFLCHYTKVRVDEIDPGSPWFLTFDHRVPGDARSLVVAAAWVNAMKTALSEDEFWAIIEEYERYLREGGEFDRDICEFRYWRRRPKKLA